MDLPHRPAGLDLLPLVPTGLRPLVTLALTSDPEAALRAFIAWRGTLGPQGLTAAPPSAGRFLRLIAPRVLAAPGQDALPDGDLARLRGIRREALTRDLQVRAALAPLLARLGDAGLPPALVGPRGHRGDAVPVGLSFAASAFARALDLAVAAGWRPYTPLAARLARHAPDLFALSRVAGQLSTPNVTLPLTLSRAPTPLPEPLVALARSALTTLANPPQRPEVPHAEPLAEHLAEHLIDLASLTADPNFDVHRIIDAAREARVTLTLGLLVAAALELTPRDAPWSNLADLDPALRREPIDPLEQTTLARLLAPGTPRLVAAWSVHRHAHAELSTPRAALAFAPVAISRAAFRLKR